MNFDILFYVLYFIILLIFSTLFILQSVFYSQSNSYTYQSIFLELWKFLTNKIGLFIMLIVVGVLSFVVFSYNRFIIIPILIFEFAIMLLMIDYSIVFNVKFTSRVVRLLICCSVVEMLVCCLLYRYVPIVYLGNLFSMIVIVLFILYLFSFTIMWPIEKIIGCYYLNKCKTKLSRNVNTIKIGITGSFGKTSTKEILASILSTQYNVLSTPKSYNTPFGISKTVNSSLSYQHEMFIVEMGAKKKGEIDYLCKLVNVDCGIVTSVGRQHTNTFKGIDGVYNTKKELPDYLSGRLCVFNLNNSLVRKMYGSYIGNGVGVFYLTKRRISVIKCVIKRSSYFKCFKLTKIVFFEFSKLGNFYAKNIDLSSSGSNFDLWFDGEFLGKMRCRLIGIHNITNGCPQKNKVLILKFYFFFIFFTRRII